MNLLAYSIPGFPTEISEEIETPNIGELLLMPSFAHASIEDFMDYASPFQKKLLSLTPIQGDHEYVTIISQTQFLDPNVQSVPNRVMNREDEWHRDGPSRIFHNRDRIHLFLSKCAALTEFNTRPMNFDFPDDMDGSELCRMMNEEEHGIVAQKMPANRIVTFTNHLHRTTTAPMPELRFMFRVSESNARLPLPRDKSVNPNVTVSVRNGGAGNMIPNVTKTDGKIIIHMP